MNSIEKVQSALEMVRARSIAAPGFQLFSSAVVQREYLLSVLQGTERDRSRLKNIVVGHFAVREFKESDPELADVLCAVQTIASNVAKGLKV